MLFVCCVLYAVWDCLLACLQTRPGVSEPAEASGPVRPGAGPGGFEGKRPWQPVQWNNFAKILLMSGPPGASLFSPCVFQCGGVLYFMCSFLLAGLLVQASEKRPWRTLWPAIATSECLR